MKSNRKQENKSVVLWLDQDLVQILKSKDPKFNLNEELGKFFKHRNGDSYVDIEITLDSHLEVQNMIQQLSRFNDGITKLLENVDLFEQPLIDIGTDIFYDDFDSDEEDDDNSCDRLSAYFGAFHQRPQERMRMQRQDELYHSLRKNFWLKKIKQFYNLTEKELNEYNEKQLVRFLLNRVDSNKDIVEILEHRNIRNRLGKLYTESSIAKRRYLLKKIVRRRK